MASPVATRRRLKALVKSFAEGFSAVAQRSFTKPDTAEDSAWVPNQLEYQFAVGPQTAKADVSLALRAEQYSQGHLD